jgi:hypothetical protein
MWNWENEEDDEKENPKNKNFLEMNNACMRCIENMNWNFAVLGKESKPEKTGDLSNR